MRIPWKLKSTIFYFIDFFDGHNFLYFLQKNVTGRSRKKNLTIAENWLKHKRTLDKFAAMDSIFEFGAGKSLAQNLFLSSVVKEQLVVDLYPMVDLSLVDSARKRLSEQVKLKSKIKIEDISDLSGYGITYKAPFDATATGLPDNQIDACISTNTLEHIPREQIIRIFRELNRILKRDGIVSAIIDYSDHYAHTDKSISLLNFLRYDEKTWSRYNHASHHQNRLRHRDYINIFRELDFEVIAETLVFDETDIPKEITALFSDTDESWRATSAHIILRNR